MAKDEMEIDPVLLALGPTGRYAVLQMVLYFAGYFSDGHHMFSYVFIGQDVNHKCAAPGVNSSLEMTPLLAIDWLNFSHVTYEDCVISVTNNNSGLMTHHEYSCVYGMEYDVPKEKSIISEFDLVCEREGLSELTQTLLSLGVGLGAIVFPWLSDLFGRKRILVITELMILMATTVAAFAPNYAVFAITKFFIGFISCGVGLTAVTAVVELFPTSSRAMTSGLVSTVAWVLCIATLSPVAYLLRDGSWRRVHLALIGSSSFVVFMIFFLDEPIRWLVANGRYQQAEAAMKRAARLNGKKASDILAVFHGLRLEQQGGDSAAFPAARLILTSGRDLAEPQTSDHHDPVTVVTAFQSPGPGEVIPSAARGQEVDMTHSDNIAGNGQIHCQDKGDDSGTDGRIKMFAAATSPGKETEVPFAEIVNGKNPSHAEVAEKAAMLNAGRNGEEAKEPVEERTEGALGFVDLFRHRLMRKNILISLVIWFVDSLTYFGLYLITDSLALDLYLGFFLNTMVEGVSGLFMICMLNRLGRKKTVGIFQTTAAVGLIVSGVCFSYEDDQALRIAGTVASLVGRMGIGGAFNVMFMYTPEIFPTNIRNRALGTSVAASTVGGMVAPYSNILSTYVLWGPGVLFGCLNVVAVLCLLVLPESNGKELPQTIQDLESWYDVPSSKQMGDKKNKL